MIKRLRAQFIFVTMLLITALLLTMFGTICHSTWHSMNEEAIEALQTATFEPWCPGGMGRDGAYTNYPCFIVCIDNQGNIYTNGHANYDLSNEALLRKFFDKAKATGDNSGMLWDYNLKFLRVELWNMEEYVFTDMTGALQTMETLYITCTVLFFVALLLLFAVSWLLAKWMTRPIERTMAQQRQFLADASHELKTPLTVILTNAELLQSEEYSEADRKRFSGSILTMAVQMRELVENLLELAQMDNHQFRLRKQDVQDFSELTENSVMAFEPVYFEAGLELESQVQIGLQVRGSSQHLSQVVDILLDNGQKYATPGSVVRLELSQNRKYCLLRVISRGETLTPKQCKDIFKRFYRVDEARSAHRSYGLGLSIAQSIVREHRGKIWAQGNNGVNTFFVQLPIVKSK